MDISVIIVNYNTAALMAPCLDSVFKQTAANYEIIVVDNASQDDSVTVLQQYQDRITLIANQTNVGFGKANNQAAKVARGNYLFLLNPDAELQDTSAFVTLLAFMNNNLQCGLLGTRIVKTADGAEAKPCYFYPGQRYLKKQLQLPGKIAWVLGASMFIRQEVFAQVNGFDEDYFLYAEEVDLCLRIRQHAYTIEYCPAVVVRHIGGASESSNPPVARWQRKYAGLQLFLRKHYSQTEVIKLLQRDKRRKGLRLCWLSLKKYCGISLNDKQQLKYLRYQATYQMACKALESYVTS